MENLNSVPNLSGQVTISLDDYNGLLKLVKSQQESINALKEDRSIIIIDDRVYNLHAKVRVPYIVRNGDADAAIISLEKSLDKINTRCSLLEKNLKEMPILLEEEVIKNIDLEEELAITRSELEYLKKSKIKNKFLSWLRK